MLTELRPVPFHRPTGDPCDCGRPWRDRDHLCLLCGTAGCEHAPALEAVAKPEPVA